MQYIPKNLIIFIDNFMIHYTNYIFLKHNTKIDVCLQKKNLQNFNRILPRIYIFHNFIVGKCKTV